MSDPLNIEKQLVAALRLTAPPPQAWVQAAAMIPATVGDLAALESAVASPAFQQRFASDPAVALQEHGLTPAPALVAAVRDLLGAG